MTAELLPVTDADLEQAFDHYRAIDPVLGTDFLKEFRRAIDRILSFPDGWQQLDAMYRRCRLRRFPYGVLYRVDEPNDRVIVVGVLHLSRDPGLWRRRI